MESIFISKDDKKNLVKKKKNSAKEEANKRPFRRKASRNQGI